MHQIKWHVVVRPAQPHGCDVFSHGVLFSQQISGLTCLSQLVPEDTIINAIGGDDDLGRPFRLFLIISDLLL